MILCQYFYITFLNTMKDINDDTYKQRKVIATSMTSPLASFIAKFVTYPIDTVKTKIQADRIALKNLSNYKVGHSIELSSYFAIKLRI